MAAFVKYVMTSDNAVREWRKAKGLQPGMPSIPHPVRDPAASPTISVSRKKPKTSHSVASLSLGASSLALQPSVQPLSSAPMPRPKSKKTKSVSVMPFWRMREE